MWHFSCASLPCVCNICLWKQCHSVHPVRSLGWKKKQMKRRVTACFAFKLCAKISLSLSDISGGRLVAIDKRKLCRVITCKDSSSGLQRKVAKRVVTLLKECIIFDNFTLTFVLPFSHIQMRGFPWFGTVNSYLFFREILATERAFQRAVILVSNVLRARAPQGRKARKNNPNLILPAICHMSSFTPNDFDRLMRLRYSSIVPGNHTGK